MNTNAGSVRKKIKGLNLLPFARVSARAYSTCGYGSKRPRKRVWLREEKWTKHLTYIRGNI